MLKRPDTYLLKTFGGLHLVGSDGSPVELSRRRLALLVLLASAGDRGVARERLVAYLWPDSPTEAGRHSLEQMLSALRARLGTAVFVGTDPVRLDSRIITSELALLDLRPGEVADGDDLPEGAFLDGFYLEGLKDFEDWVERERARLHDLLLETLAHLARRAESVGDHAAAVRQWRRYVHVDPLRAEGAVGLMRALAAGGDRAGAVHHASTYQRLIKEELDLPPDLTVAALGAELQSRTTAEPHPGPSHPRTLEQSPGGERLSPTPGEGGEAFVVGPMPPPPTRGRRLAYAVTPAMVVALGVVAAIGWPPGSGGGQGRGLPAVQVTFSGDAHWPSISPDHGRVAYWTTDPGQVNAERAILRVRDVAGAGEVSLATFQWLGPTAWTRDGRHVLVFGLPLPGAGEAPRVGMYAVPLLGGAPRFLGCCLGSRIPGTDTLVQLPPEGPGGSRILHVVTIDDGVIRDTIEIPDWPSTGRPTAVFAAPDGRRFAVARRQAAGLVIQILARSGGGGSAIRLEAPVRDPPDLLGWVPDGRGLLVLQLATGATGGVDLVRIPVRGLEAVAEPELVAPAVPALFGWSLGEGGSFAYSGGTIERRVWALVAEGDPDDLHFKSHLTEVSTGLVLGRPSPDGTRLLITRRVASGYRSELGLARPGGRPVYPIGAVVERQLQFGWTWKGDAAWVMRASGESGTTIERVDLATGVRETRFAFDALRLRAAADLADGRMLALSNDDTGLLLLGPGPEEIRELELPDWAFRLNAIGPSPDGVRVPLIVEGKRTADASEPEVMASVVDPGDGSWHRYPVEGPRFDEPPSLAADGSMVVPVEQPPGPTSWFRSGPEGQPRPIREVPLHGAQFLFSLDRRLAVANQVVHQADAFVVPDFELLLRR